LNYFKGLIFLLLFAGLSGCNSNKIPKEGNVRAHVIKYKVTYLNEKAGSVPTSVLPGYMTLIFADHYALNRIDGFLGQFSLSFIADLKERTVINMLKIFDIKLVYYGQSDEIPVCVAPIEAMKVKEEDSNAKFAGFNCRKLLITSSNYGDFIVYSTNQLNIKNPNNATPYSSIDEVLLMFNTRLSMLKMQMNATKYEAKEVAWELFQVPPDYKKVSKEYMEQKLNELFK
jgi:hypothetical protein